MEETHASPQMVETDLINSLERISSKFPDRILVIEGYILKDNHKEQLEIIIFKGFSSSTTHPIEIDLEKKVFGFDYKLEYFKIYKSPLTGSNKDNCIRANQNSFFFLNQKNWL